MDLLLNALLIPQLGVYDAATATVVGYGLITIYLSYWTRMRVQYCLSPVTFVKSLVATTITPGLLLVIQLSLSHPIRLVHYLILGIEVSIFMMILIARIDHK